MTRALALRIGPLRAEGHIVVRSGIRWLIEDGRSCRPGEVIAYCNIGLVPDVTSAGTSVLLPGEGRDLQVAFAPVVGGIVRRAPDASRGGFLDRLTTYSWTDDFVIGGIECADGALVHPDAEQLRLIVLAGRRMTELAEVRSGLLTGWHDRTRAWWGESAAAPGTLVAMGTCEAAAILRGERSGFLELFEGVPGPAHVVSVQDEPLVPCARVVLEQLGRTAGETASIAEDLARTFPAGPVVPEPADWLFAGSLLNALGRSPLTESYDVLTRAGLRHAGPAGAILLSLNAEVRDVARHRRLGYTVSCYDFRLAQAGPAVRAWFRSHFERVSRGPDEIRDDYRQLLTGVRDRLGATVLVLNSVSSRIHEDIQTYAGLDHPLGANLASIRAKEMNLVLHDLAREFPLEIVDMDGIAAGLGLHRHVPDGIHQSGPLQAELRAEILRILRRRRIPGFGAA